MKIIAGAAIVVLAALVLPLGYTHRIGLFVFGVLILLGPGIVACLIMSYSRAHTAKLLFFALLFLFTLEVVGRASSTSYGVNGRCF